MATLRSPVLERVEPAAPTSRRRDPWFDNTKLVLIVLVVVGHTWSQLPESRTVVWGYDFLYSWHMPAFVLVTGYLSRSMTWEPRRIWSLVTTLAVPYVIFECALTFVHHHFGGAEVNDLLVVPHSPMWFLVALIGWRLLTPAFLAMNRFVAVGLAVALSLAAGLTSYETLAVNRILGFLPFFVIGLHLQRADWDRLRRVVTVPRALLVLGTMFVLARNTDDFVETSWFHYDTTYAALGSSAVGGGLTRLVVIAIGLIGAVAFFALVPRSRSWITALGTATMTVYLFHDFVVLAMAYSSFPDWAADHLGPALVLATTGSVLVGLALATPPVVRALSPLADPVGHLARRRDPRSG